VPDRARRASGDPGRVSPATVQCREGEENRRRASARQGVDGASGWTLPLMPERSPSRAGAAWEGRCRAPAQRRLL